MKIKSVSDVEQWRAILKCLPSEEAKCPPSLKGRANSELRNVATAQALAGACLCAHLLMRLRGHALKHFNVQGIDFAYTLQGWLKAINGGLIDRDSDMGGDGFKNVQSAVGNFIPTGVIDALAMTLGYYEGDYAAIGGNAVELANGYNSAVAKNLYNGNIRHATYQMYGLGNEVMRYDYGYDQLQRLVAMDSKTLANAAAPGGVDGPLSWTGAAFGGYREAYSYDANGNILTLNRRARRSNGVSALMDSLVYNYTFTGVNMKNRLKDVSDFAVSVTPNSNFATDIEHSTVNQGFVYDSDGRMSVDRKERMGVYWTPFDKPYLVIDTVPNPFKINTVNYGYDALHNRVEKIVSADTSRTAYIRDASGNIMAQYELKQGRWLWTEQHLYGSERLGVDHVLDSVWTDTISAFTYVWVSDPICQCMVQREVRTDSLQHHVRYARAKKYEITNHLGNVLVVVSDAAIASSNTDFLLPDVVSATDYFPFGMEMPNRSFSADAYSFGFNTQMESPEILPGHTTAMFWEYDARIGRRWELDPVVKVWESGYAVNYNNPICYQDVFGDTGTDPIKVQKGNTLAGLASAYNTSPEAIKTANPQIDWNDKSRTGKKKDWLYEGEELNIPQVTSSRETISTGNVYQYEAPYTTEYFGGFLVNPGTAGYEVTFNLILVTSFDAKGNEVLSLDEEITDYRLKWHSSGSNIGVITAGLSGVGALKALRYANAALSAKGVPALRASYVKEVEGIANIASRMREQGKSSEQIARHVHALRRAIGVKYKSLTPKAKLAEIYARNLEKYGDKLGPTIDYLRQKGKSWDDIIESASRSGGKDLGF